MMGLVWKYLRISLVAIHHRHVVHQNKLGSYPWEHIHGFLTIPRMYQIVKNVSWDGLNQPEVAVMVFGNQDGDFLLFTL